MEREIFSISKLPFETEKVSNITDTRFPKIKTKISIFITGVLPM